MRANAAFVIAVLEQHGESRLLAQLEVNVGNVYTRLDEYRLARGHYRRAAELFEALEDDFGQAVTRYNLGVVEMNANCLEEAEEAWTRARDSFSQAGLGVHVADCDYSLEHETVSLAEQLATKLGSAVKVGKQAFYQQLQMPIDQAYAYTGDVMAENMLHRDTEEGISAFIEKRSPNWSQLRKDDT